MNDDCLQMALQSLRKDEGDAIRIGFRQHRDRPALIEEAHARPAGRIPTPSIVTRIAMLSRIDSGEDFAHLERLCELTGVEPPPPGAKHFRIKGDDWSLVWERHTELTTYTVCAALSGAAAAEGPISEPPLREWLQHAPGEAIAASRIAVVHDDQETSAEYQIREAFGDNDRIAAEIGASGVLITDFRVKSDDFVHFIYIDRSDDERHRGRIVQALLEIETYRMAALLALPLARRAADEIVRHERQLAELAERIVAAPHIHKDRDLLIRLSRIAAEVEAIGNRTAFRFAGADAYYRIVRDRVSRLDENRIGQELTVADFIDRRLDPAMRTVEATDRRRRDLAAQITRAIQLLQVRIDVAVEEQNQLLLRSLENRARTQLRLQETVESLSIVAITYYGAGILHAIIGGLDGFGEVGTHQREVVVAAAIPLIAASAMLFMRYRRTVTSRKRTGVERKEKA